VSWLHFPPIIAGGDWVTVKVSGEYETIQPLIETLKADGFRYRDLSKSGGQRSWDRSFRVSELIEGFLVDSPWMIAARQSDLTGVAVYFFDALDRLAMAYTIQNGELLKHAAGSYRPFHLADLKATMTPLDNRLE
jgi:hypothetical protein